jgi:hypothetical protein
MKHETAAATWIVIMACTILSATHGQEKAAQADPRPGLVAHYFEDPRNWDGAWPDQISVPRANPLDWTFSAYRYSRVEPVVNHLFIRRGWFSVRWTGLLDTAAPAPRSCNAVEGEIEINPANSDLNEFCLVTADGAALTRDSLVAGFEGYSGQARAARFRPKGNANENRLVLDGAPYPLRNGVTYEIGASRMTVCLSNSGGGKGCWRLSLSAVGATLSCRRDASAVAADHAQRSGRSSESRGSAEYRFYVLADDGCRLMIDGRTLIDDWRACSEKSPDALRSSPPVNLSDGVHAVTVEYFQGQSLPEGDNDPIALYWSCPERGIERQIMPPAVLWHTEENASSADRAK